MCGIPRLNSTQVSANVEKNMGSITASANMHFYPPSQAPESHHQFIKKEFVNSFRGGSTIERSRTLLRNHSILENMRLQQLRKVGSATKESHYYAPGDDILVPDSSRSGIWIGRIQGISYETGVFYLRWYERCDSSVKLGFGGDYFPIYDLLGNVETIPQYVSIILGRASMVRLKSVLPKDTCPFPGCTYALNIASFSHRTDTIAQLVPAIDDELRRGYS